MNCEDVEIELSGGEPSEAARAHVSTCAACARTAQVLELAVLGPLDAAEHAVVNRLPMSTVASWQAARHLRRPARRWASLALAAGVGALVASAVMVKTRPEPVGSTQTVHVLEPEVPMVELASDDPNFSEDEVFLDVGWPSPTEGDL
jgi:hypothetical protein